MIKLDKWNIMLALIFFFIFFPTLFLNNYKNFILRFFGIVSKQKFNSKILEMLSIFLKIINRLIYFSYNKNEKQEQIY